ncbi:MAG: sugar transporter [Silicimonas sp.]|nr:sugar transporter [Silicimonas sp.]
MSVLRPPADPARPRARHIGVFAGFLLLVVVPLALAAWYLVTIAADQFASTVGFSVRKEEAATPIELFGGIADVASTGSSDSDILYEFISSQEMVEVLQTRIDLTALFSKPARDPIFAYDTTGTIEDLQDYWNRMVRVTYDTSTELIEVRVLAFSPEDARTIATGIFDESARLIDDLSAIAQEDAIAFAKDELERAVERLKLAREAMTAFRSRTQIVDPTADLQGQMGLLSTLEQQLAEALISADLLRESTRSNDPRITQADRRIAVIEARIDDERRKLGVGGAGDAGDDYATVLAEFERLAVDRQFAEQAYTAALVTYDQALAEARRKSRYLAAYIRPTLAEASKYPKTFELLGVLAFLSIALWGISVLVFYSIRDRR